MEQNGKKIHKKRWLIPVIIIAGFFTVTLIYLLTYYPAEPEAKEALVSDEAVSVEETEYGWFFNGPSKEELCIFYPGARVEPSAYAPLMHSLAEKGIDVCLIKMPFNIALFDANKADMILQNCDYDHIYMGGHSLGGAIAGDYAANHPDRIEGVVLCASYLTHKLAHDQVLLSIYGSEDQVLNRDKMAEAKQYEPYTVSEYIIDGGNHAHFGSYGEQSGDGNALIPAEEQQRETVLAIYNTIMTESKKNRT